jgi:hypothetical protein
MIDPLRESSIDVQPPFIVVAERRHATIRGARSYCAAVVSEKETV